MRRAFGLAVALVLLASTPAAAASHWDRDRAYAAKWAGAHPRDGYPWRGDTNASNAEPYSHDLDPWGYPVRWCVSYVAWYEAQRGHPMYAHDWPAAASDDLAHPQPGWVATSSPSVGDVVLWVAGQDEVAYFQDDTPAPIGIAGGAGHVGVVTHVYPHGAIQVAMYNVWWAPLGFDTEKMRSPGHFLHPTS